MLVGVAASQIALPALTAKKEPHTFALRSSVFGMALAFTQAQRTLASIRSMIPRLVTNGVVIAGEPTLYVEPANVPPVMDFLKSHTGTRCKALMDITAVDVPTREKRFEVRPSPPRALPLPSRRPLRTLSLSPGPVRRHQPASAPGRLPTAER